MRCGERKFSLTTKNVSRGAYKEYDGTMAMEILGLRVRHKRLGVGTITHRSGNVFIVTFPARHGPKLREFTYPDAFADRLEPLNVFVQDAVAQLIREKMGKT